MIYVLGGSTKMFAVIGVTYPAGSTCTCTNGTKTLTAKGTSGTAIFNVPSTGTWTVSCTNGSKTASKSVSITAEGQTESVTLAYEYVLYDAGTKYVDFTEVKTASYADAPTISWNDANVTLDCGSTKCAQAQVATTNLIDISPYSKLRCKLSALTVGNGTKKFEIGLSSTAPASYSLYTLSNALATASSSQSSSSGLTLEADISEIAGSASISMALVALSETYGNLSATVTKLWLE